MFVVCFEVIFGKSTLRSCGEREARADSREDPDLHGDPPDPSVPGAHPHWVFPRRGKGMVWLTPPPVQPAGHVVLGAGVPVVVPEVSQVPGVGVVSPPLEYLGICPHAVRSVLLSETGVVELGGDAVIHLALGRIELDAVTAIPLLVVLGPLVDGQVLLGDGVEDSLRKGFRELFARPIHRFLRRARWVWRDGRTHHPAIDVEEDRASAEVSHQSSACSMDLRSPTSHLRGSGRSPMWTHGT